MPSKQQGGALRRAGDVQQGGALRRAGDVQQGGALVDGGKKQSGGGGKKRSAGKKGADLEQIRAETGIPFLNKKVGDKHEVWDGHALQTKGGLTVVDFLLNRTGKVVSKRKFESGGRLRETLTGTKANLALRMTGEDRLKQLQSGSRNINTGKVAASTLEKKKAGGKKKKAASDKAAAAPAVVDLTADDSAEDEEDSDFEEADAPSQVGHGAPGLQKHLQRLNSLYRRVENGEGPYAPAMEDADPYEHESVSYPERRESEGIPEEEEAEEA